MKRIFTSLMLLGTSFVCNHARADSVDVYTGFTVFYADNISPSDQWQIDVKNGYLSLVGYDHSRAANFACSLWYTSPNFASMKETALAFINAEPHNASGEFPAIQITRDAAGTCTEMWFAQIR